MSVSENQILVTKASGEKVPFSLVKLQQSLKRSGADDNAIEEVIDELKPYLRDGISTKKIYTHAFNILKKTSRAHAARYSLKQAVMELGPSGFPFEKFISEILRSQGFAVQVGVFVEGHCVKHEIDVVAEKGDQHFMVECKFHNTQGIKCDVKIPLYIQARFQDVEKHWLTMPGHNTKFHQGWVVTNTKFTADAIQYGTCAGLHLLGWDYPKKGSLNELIDLSGLHPITCMTTLTKLEKQDLLEKRIVLCKEICSQPDLLDALEITPLRKERILKEGCELCVQSDHQQKVSN
ncbi:MAG: restriction endonuclease [Bacteroidetes bacterium]|nr:restriction endonuclease [Bacteroidota bacterium]